MQSAIRNLVFLITCFPLFLAGQTPGIGKNSISAESSIFLPLFRTSLVYERILAGTPQWALSTTAGYNMTGPIRKYIEEESQFAQSKFALNPGELQWGFNFLAGKNNLKAEFSVRENLKFFQPLYSDTYLPAKFQTYTSTGFFAGFRRIKNHWFIKMHGGLITDWQGALRSELSFFLGSYFGPEIKRANPDWEFPLKIGLFATVDAYKFNKAPLAVSQEDFGEYWAGHTMWRRFEFLENSNFGGAAGLTFTGRKNNFLGFRGSFSVGYHNADVTVLSSVGWTEENESPPLDTLGAEQFVLKYLADLEAEFHFNRTGKIQPKLTLGGFMGFRFGGYGTYFFNEDAYPYPYLQPGFEAGPTGSVSVQIGRIEPFVRARYGLSSFWTRHPLTLNSLSFGTVFWLN